MRTRIMSLAIAALLGFSAIPASAHADKLEWHSQIFWDFESAVRTLNCLPSRAKHEFINVATPDGLMVGLAYQDDPARHADECTVDINAPKHVQFCRSVLCVQE